MNNGMTTRWERRKEARRRRTEELAAVVRERERRRLAWERQNRLDEKHDTQANAFACLIEALIEMRPYTPEVTL